MKEKIITKVQLEMKGFLSEEQMKKLKEVLDKALYRIQIIEVNENKNDQSIRSKELVNLF